MPEDGGVGRGGDCSRRAEGEDACFIDKKMNEKFKSAFLLSILKLKITTLIGEVAGTFKTYMQEEAVSSDLPFGSGKGTWYKVFMLNLLNSQTSLH